MKSKSLISLFVLLLITKFSFSIENPQMTNNGIRIMFYNVENLFHPSNDSLKDDDEFTPEGTRYWTEKRYYIKINQIAKNVMAIGEFDPPAIVGLCEIENRQVLEDLIYKSPLKKFGYEIIHEESADNRGIDVALLYRPDYIEYINHKAIVLKFVPESRPTRDILYFKGMVNEDTLHFFVNHWPSRYGGQLATAPKREFAAKTLRFWYDSLLQVNPMANIIAMGDFNDHPDDESMHKILKAQKDTLKLKNDDLINLIWRYAPDKGTHKYQRIWGVLDQFIVNQNLVFGKSGFKSPMEMAKIFEGEWLFEPEADGVGKTPNRTYIGFKYHGGYSDHLPIFMDVIFVKNNAQE